MAGHPGPYDFTRTGLILTPGSDVVARDFGRGFYEALDTDFDGFAGHVLVSRHAFSEDWEGWEMHPKGDEIVALESGNIDFVLWIDGREQAVRLDTPGTCVVVPKGVWHTARPRRTTSLLFVTPGEGTEHAEAPPGYGNG